MKTDRRHFFKQAGALAAGTLILPSLTKAAGLNHIMLAQKPVGIQLFTVFEKMKMIRKERWKKSLPLVIKK